MVLVAVFDLKTTTGQKQNIMKNYILIILTALTTLLATSPNLVAQDFDPAKLEKSLKTATFKDKFETASRLMSENLYVYAAKIWEDIIAKGEANGNVYYKAGLCYLNIANETEKALPLLQETEPFISKKYDPYSFLEKNAPIETYYYLAKAYHLNQEISKAEETYNVFKSKAHPRHILHPKADLGLAQCQVAKKLLRNPKNFVISNIGDVINTEYDEYSPVITMDESALFFTSRRLRKDSSNAGVFSPQDGKYYEDVYVSYKNLKTGDWMEPEILSKISRKPGDNEATISVSGDGQLLFIYRGDKGNGDIYVSENDGDKFGYPRPIGEGEKITDINSDSWETHATISADGRTLYFVSDRPGGLGGRDIYRSVKLPNGEWSKALNIGAPINTPYDEDAPFFHPDGKTLYYSSNGPKSMGGFDIFFSLNIEGDKWSEPFNIGYPLNSVKDDIFFTTTADGQRGYFSSAKKGGYGEKDIYTIDLKRKEQAQVAILKGYIDAGTDGNIPDGIVIWVTDKTEQGEPKEYKPNKRNGAYVFNLTPCHEYFVEYTRDDKTFYETDLKVPCGSGYQEINKVINLDGVALDKLNKQQGGENIADKDKSDKNNLTKEDLKIDGSIKDETVTLNKEAVDKLNKDEQETADKTEVNVQKVQFQKYYGYNEKGIASEEQRFITFVKGVEDIIAKRGYANVEVEGSASTVPTRTYGSNKKLAKLRSEDAKKVLLDVLKKHGVDLSKVKLMSVNSVVQGPKYNWDYKNEDKYTKYQYILLKAF